MGTLRLKDNALVSIVKTIWIALIVSVCMLSIPKTGFTQNNDSKVSCDTRLTSENESDPTQLAMRGIACFEDKNFVRALRFYRQAFAVEPSSVLTAGIGRALQELSLPSLAKPYFAEYLANENPNQATAAKINLQLEKIDSQLQTAGELTINTSEPGATIFLVLANTQWEKLGESPLSIKLMDGSYEILAKKEGTITEPVVVEMVNGDAQTTHIELNDENKNFQISNRSWRRTGTYFIYGSVPLVAAGTTLFTIGQIKTSDAEIAKNDTTRDSLLTSGSQFKQYGLIAGGVGLVGLAAGIIFYFNGSAGDSETTMFEFTPKGISVKHVF